MRNKKRLFFNNQCYVVAHTQEEAVEIVGTYKKYPKPLSQLDYDEINGSGFRPINGAKKITLSISGNPDRTATKPAHIWAGEYPVGVLVDLERGIHD